MVQKLTVLFFDKIYTLNICVFCRDVDHHFTIKMGQPGNYPVNKFLLI